MEAYDYNTIKEIAKDNGLKVDDLLALAPTNDPFYTGRPSELAAARWFADMWRICGFTTGVHVRRVHYRLATTPGESYKKPNGEIYQNTDNDWKYLASASKWARYLGLIDPDLFVDRKNPDAVVYAKRDVWAEDPEPGYRIDNDPEESLEYGYGPVAMPRLPGVSRLPDLPALAATGYDDIEQGYHVEIWVEKTTMNDIVEPLCRRYRANMVTGAGEMSITAVRLFLQRVREANKPARILYISDFDPAGLGMPISVARKVEFYQRTDGDDDLDIVLQPIVLTADQVHAYSLPRIPVKDSDLRKGNFEAAYGTGQVELDALEALYEGELTKIVEAEILRYYDKDLKTRSYLEKANLQEYLDRLSDEVAADHQESLESLRAAYAELLDDYGQMRGEFDDLARQFEPRIEAHNERKTELLERAREAYATVYADLRAVEVDLEDYALPDPDVTGDPEGVLYDSERNYLDQIDSYKLRRNNQ